jgi:hypothetical protein
MPPYTACMKAGRVTCSKLTVSVPAVLLAVGGPEGRKLPANMGGRPGPGTMRVPAAAVSAAADWPLGPEEASCGLLGMTGAFCLKVRGAGNWVSVVDQSPQAVKLRLPMAVANRQRRVLGRWLFIGVLCLLDAMFRGFKGDAELCWTLGVFEQEQLDCR